MKTPNVILTVLGIVIVLTGIYLKSMFSENSEVIPYNFAKGVNYKTTFNGKLSKNYSQADVQGIRGYAVTKVNTTSSDASITKVTNHSTSGKIIHANKSASSATSISSQSGNDAYIKVNSTGQSLNSDNFAQSVNPTISASFRPVSNVSVKKMSAKSAIASNNVSGNKNNSKPMQKTGGKPAEPGLGTLPVGDGVWILLLLTLIYGGWRYLRF